MLANMAAAVDIISEGRLELGIGAGCKELETAAYGIDLPPRDAAAQVTDPAWQRHRGLLPR